MVPTSLPVAPGMAQIFPPTVTPFHIVPFSSSGQPGWSVKIFLMFGAYLLMPSVRSRMTPLALFWSMVSLPEAKTSIFSCAAMAAVSCTS